MKIERITIFAGHDKDGIKESFDRLNVVAGNTVSIVGPTGSGKTSFVNDIEMLTQGDTITGRRMKINGKAPSMSYRQDASQNPIVLITQHTNFLADLTVNEFLTVHARARNIRSSETVERTIFLTNKLTGEKVSEKMKMTTLSGGQSRALMIADAVVIGQAPIVLLDEIENAGIFKKEAMEMVRSEGKIIIFVTHDPVVALLCDIRLVMKNGGIVKVHRTTEMEKKARKKIIEQDIMLNVVRERVRRGEVISL
ncbi:MAG: ATP-binding cassette domain-containing protein [Syntrophorhabdus sp.]|nr:ATP-binding cassette domain-containing protein [Syntrophorhabdus sp.]